MLETLSCALLQRCVHKCCGFIKRNLAANILSTAQCNFKRSSGALFRYLQVMNKNNYYNKIQFKHSNVYRESWMILVKTLIVYIQWLVASPGMFKMWTFVNSGDAINGDVMTMMMIIISIIVTTTFVHCIKPENPNSKAQQVRIVKKVKKEGSWKKEVDSFPPVVVTCFPAAAMSSMWRDVWRTSATNVPKKWATSGRNQWRCGLIAVLQLVGVYIGYCSLCLCICVPSLLIPSSFLCLSLLVD